MYKGIFNLKFFYVNTYHTGKCDAYFLDWLNEKIMKQHAQLKSDQREILGFRLPCFVRAPRQYHRNNLNSQCVSPPRYYQMSNA